MISYSVFFTILLRVGLPADYWMATQDPSAAGVIDVLVSMVNIGSVTDGIVVATNIAVGAEMITTVGAFGSAVGWGHGREVLP